jgi:FkbM family methyltransferase
MNNISSADYFLAHISYLKGLITLVLRYRRVYQNYSIVLRKALQKSYPIEAVLREGGQTKSLNSYREVLYNAMLLDTKSRSHSTSPLNFDIKLDFDTAVATIIAKKTQDNDGITLKLYDGINNGDIFGIFVDQEYSKLDVSGKTVIDIGANIGDTAIYFVLRGASRIIAIEPYPRNCETATKNISENNFSDKIDLVLAGCAGRPTTINIDENYHSNPVSQLTESIQGIKVPLLTLEQILSNNDVKSGAVLKMDCEGYEYDIILTTPKETLQKFEQIQIEYHFGYKDLKQKLEDVGFDVEITRPEIPGLLSRYVRSLKRSRTEDRQHNETDADNLISPNYRPRSIYESGNIGYLYAKKIHNK